MPAAARSKTAARLAETCAERQTIPNGWRGASEKTRVERQNTDTRNGYTRRHLMLIRYALPIALLAFCTPLAAQDGTRSETVTFAHGTSSKIVKARIKGYAGVNYSVQARAGQTMTVSLTTNNRSNYFNVTAPGADAAMFIGSSSGNRFQVKIPSSGSYAINTYLMRNAARRGEMANYTLSISVR